ncbi:contact-dependent growth inhibition system immunity protein (plasmid) [Escherichia coli]|uniref:contact-dependent growth inhibition system immunity protein n=1 Tax=Escherichia coli TaxID=562 RepID=UPI00339CA7CA
MITLRKLIGNINMTKEPEQQSPLELWFERIIDVPLEKLTVEDLCRAIRQNLCIDQLMPRVLEVLTKEPLAGEYYDGELIAALSTIKEKFKRSEKYLYPNKATYKPAKTVDINDDLRKDILKINQIIV